LASTVPDFHHPIAAFWIVIPGGCLGQLEATMKTRFLFSVVVLIAAILACNMPISALLPEPFEQKMARSAGRSAAAG